VDHPLLADALARARAAIDAQRGRPRTILVPEHLAEAARDFLAGEPLEDTEDTAVDDGNP
jgi:hypothetical protein